MDLEGTFRQPLYIGKIILIDIEQKEIIAERYGQFDTQKLQLHASIDPNRPGSFQRVIIVLQTSHGFFAPLVIFSHTLLPPTPSAVTHNMNLCLSWPLSTGYSHILETFTSVEIIIDASHYIDEISSTIDTTKHWTELRRKAAAISLDMQRYGPFEISARTGYSVRRYKITLPTATRADMSSYLCFNIRRTDTAGFDFNSLLRSLLAFKAFWINSHDFTDCTIRKIKLGNDITLVLSQNKLYAYSSQHELYRSILPIDASLDLSSFAKIVHFFFNPERKKRLSSSSKVGLALVRLVHYRFSNTNRPLDNEIADLIFSLQSMSESIAEGSIRTTNRIRSRDTKEGIIRVIDSIRKIQHELPDNVRDFYMKSPEVIYKAICRPTFQQSLEIALAKLEMDITRHRSMLRTIDKARRQVVHSEGYNTDFLASFSTKDTSFIEQVDGDTVKLTTLRETGELEKLYRLLQDMTHKYFLSYGE